MDTPLSHSLTNTHSEISREVNWIVAINHQMKTKIEGEADKVVERDEEKQKTDRIVKRMLEVNVSVI